MFRPANLKDYSYLASRALARRWVILGTFAFVTVLGGGMVLSRGKLYESSAMILIQDQTRQANPGAQAPDIGRKLGVLKPIIFSRTNVEQVIKQFTLFEAEQGGWPMDKRVDYVRARIGVNVRGRDSFGVSFTHADPKVAQSITDHLSRLFIQSSEVESVAGAQDQVDFLLDQVGQLRTELNTWDDKIAHFQEENAEFLRVDPASGQQALTEQLKGIDANIRAAEARRASMGGRGRVGGSDQPRVIQPPDPPELVALEAELKAARAELAGLQRRYTDEHPDVLTARSKLSAIEQSYRKFPRPQPITVAPSKGNPRAVGEVTVAERELRELREEQAALKKELANLKESSRRGPAVTSQLEGLERERKRISDSLDKRSQQLEEARGEVITLESKRGEVFKIQDPANLPNAPTSVSRTVLMAGVSFVGLLLGLMIALVLAFVDRRVYSVYQLTRMTDLPVIAVIPKY